MLRTNIINTSRSHQNNKMIAEDKEIEYNLSEIHDQTSPIGPEGEELNTQSSSPDKNKTVEVQRSSQAQREGQRSPAVMVTQNSSSHRRELSSPSQALTNSDRKSNDELSQQMAILIAECKEKDRLISEL